MSRIYDPGPKVASVPPGLDSSVTGVGSETLDLNALQTLLFRPR